MAPRSPFRPYRAASGWAFLIGILLLLPGDDSPSRFLVVAAFTAAGGDKLIHGTLFAVLGWLLGRAAGAGTLNRSVVFALGAGYAGLTELGQTFVPGRGADAWDLAADVVGLGLGWAMARQTMPGVRPVPEAP